MTNIKQNTPEWLQAKKDYIGGSEIYSLVYYYCQEELKQANITDLEKPFSSALEIYLQKKFKLDGEPINEVNSKFGLGMEEYIFYKIKKEMDIDKFSIVDLSKSFHVKDKEMMLACSPDGFLDVNGQNILLEFKTAPYGFKFESEPRWSYLFQLQYNMLVCERDNGLIAVLSSKDAKYDKDYYKGEAVGMLKINAPDDIDYYLSKIYQIEHFLYSKNETIQELCLLAIKRFKKDIENNKFPDASIDSKEIMVREKKLLIKSHPDRSEILEVNEGDIARLINERGVCNSQKNEVARETEELNLQIIEVMNKNNLLEIKTDSYIAKIDKRGILSVRLRQQNK